MSMAYRVVRAALRMAIPLQMRLDVRGRDKVPIEGPVLLVSNHLGPTDPAIVVGAVPRQVYVIAKAEVFAWPVFGGIARASGAVPLRRGESDREGLQTVLALLQRGHCVLMYPEGTYARAPQPAALLRVKTGAAWLAMHSGCAVVPVGQWGSERVWAPRRGWKVWHRPRVCVVFGAPYRPSPPAGISMRAGLQWIAEDMAARIAALLPQEYRGLYASAPPGRQRTGTAL